VFLDFLIPDLQSSYPPMACSCLVFNLGGSADAPLARDREDFIVSGGRHSDLSLRTAPVRVPLRRVTPAFDALAGRELNENGCSCAFLDS
jgi:hypothetical protein